jgi:hypothetical protein
MIFRRTSGEVLNVFSREKKVEQAIRFVKRLSVKRMAGKLRSYTAEDADKV